MSSSTEGAAQSSSGISVAALLTAIGTGIAASGVQIAIFVLLKNKLPRIFIPKTYLVPERQRTPPPPRNPFGWMVSIFKFHDRDIISKCGLDAYFFLRYLQTLVIIFVPLALVLIPILVPINYVHGKGSTSNFNNGVSWNVTGLDTLAWGNVGPDKTHRYWAHLILAVLVVVWVCGVFFCELRVYIRIRQDYLTSAGHRLRASATTVLVSAIPSKWLTVEALTGLYDVFPGGVRNIWINRKFDKLLDKIKERDKVVAKLESAETDLIRKCKKVQMKMAKAAEKEIAKGGPNEMSKEERDKAADMEAQRSAQGDGVSAGDPQQVPRTIDEAVDEADDQAAGPAADQTAGNSNPLKGILKVPILGDGLNAMGRGMDAVGAGFEKAGAGFGKAGLTVFDGARNVGKDLDGKLTTTNGFVTIDDPQSPSKGPAKSGLNRFQSRSQSEDIDKYDGAKGPARSGQNRFHSRSQSEDIDKYDGATYSRFSEDGRTATSSPAAQRRRIERASRPVETSGGWWKFWEPPSGGFPSPLPDGYDDGDEFPLNRQESHSSKKRDKHETVEYPEYFNNDYEEDIPAEWEKYLKKSDRPTHRLPKSWQLFFPTLPFLNEKVDTIYWCRKELARLNTEIEEDQKYPERYPLMNSAFIQFNHQVAAHMAAQAVSHHIPKHMAPRTVEISPTDVIWENMSIKWWEAWLRNAVILAIVGGMIVLWAIPVSATALLGNIPALINQYPWLKFLRANEALLKSLSGILPAIVLGILFLLVPIIFYKLATLEGVQTGSMREGSVQNYYFWFLFVQVFLVVSVTGGALTTLATQVTDVTGVPSLLATSLPKASNYFFSYMIIQALSVSAGNLLQLVTLICWFLLPRILDSTARQKWKRNTDLPSVSWGSYFPTYTNFACIALVYSIVAPIILIFAIITFILLWIANRYSMLYVYKHTEDTGGLVYPRAINQTFTGLYVMEICMIGLFILVRDQNQNATCIPQAIIMLVILILTAGYQFLLHISFAPLYKHLPIIFEDDAVLRDEAFQRAQDARFEAENRENSGSPSTLNDPQSPNTDIELRQLSSPDSEQQRRYGRFDPRAAIQNTLQTTTSWATKGTRHIAAATFSTKEPPDTFLFRQRRHQADAEAQRRIGDALFGGFVDEIEDLTHEERDALVRRAFLHAAVRARRPNVWIPRDDLGVSDDEVRRTEQFAAGSIWITNRGTALDSKCRVVYGRNPPDFDEVDLIEL